MSATTRIWRYLSIFLTCFALLLVALGIGYKEYSAPAFWIALGWCVIALLWNVYLARSEHQPRTRSR